MKKRSRAGRWRAGSVRRCADRGRLARPAVHGSRGSSRGPSAPRVVVRGALPACGGGAARARLPSRSQPGSAPAWRPSSRNASSSALLRLGRRLRLRSQAIERPVPRRLDLAVAQVRIVLGVEAACAGPRPRPRARRLPRPRPCQRWRIFERPAAPVLLGLASGGRRRAAVGAGSPRRSATPRLGGWCRRRARVPSAPLLPAGCAVRSRGARASSAAMTAICPRSASSARLLVGDHRDRRLGAGPTLRSDADACCRVRGVASAAGAGLDHDRCACGRRPSCAAAVCGGRLGTAASASTSVASSGSAARPVARRPAQPPAAAVDVGARCRVCGGRSTSRARRWRSRRLAVTAASEARGRVARLSSARPRSLGAIVSPCARGTAATSACPAYRCAGACRRSGRCGRRSARNPRACPRGDRRAHVGVSAAQRVRPPRFDRMRASR